MDGIQSILDKMWGYRDCISQYDLYNDFDLETEMYVLREYCSSQEQFIEVLKVYDDGRYIWKNNKVVDTENDSESESEN
jgi:hypothetical protein